MVDGLAFSSCLGGWRRNSISEGQISGLMMPRGKVDWDFGRKRGLGRRA